MSTARKIKKNELEGSTITLNYDMWIGNELDCHGVILLKDPELIDVWSSHSFSFHPAGTPIFEEVWDTNNIYGLGNIY